MSAPKILVIPGSLRSGSYNVRLAALAVKELTLAEAEVTRISLADYPLPIYDADLATQSGPPFNALKLKQLVGSHAGVFLACPEYNASITPLLKNTIDWVSTVREPGEAQLVVFQNRAFALGGASPGRSGAMQSLLAVRQVLAVGCRALVIPEQVTVPNAGQAFNEDDELTDARAAGQLKTVVRKLVDYARVFGGTMLDPRERLIVALDVPSIAEAEALVVRLGEAVVFYKIGYQLGFAGGLDFARALADTGKQVFVDMKLHDIGNTVAQGVKSIAKLGAAFLTVHAYPQTMHAAVDARAGSQLRILAVTVLTSYDDADLAAAGYDFTVPELVAERAAQARDIGIDGVVCSAVEAELLRPNLGPGMVLVTPGIRPAVAEADDQKRVMTPAAAIKAGADYLVVGRPVIAAPDPKAAAEAIVAEIARAAGS